MSIHRNLLPFLALGLASACAPNTSTIGQHITCDVDPNTGVIARCQPGDGSGGPSTCEDIDEDGDGEPSDETDTDTDTGSGSGSGSGSGAVIAFAPSDGGDGSGSGSGDMSSSSCDSDNDGVDDGNDDDDDNDGIPDTDDCDEQEGGDGDQADLPYDIRMALGQTVTPIHDAFAERGAQPAAIISVEMDGGGAGWRLAELQSAATFTITDADCAHTGNRDIGRDRVIVTWQTTSGHVESDHLDLRYCGR
jgi:hypothetical protein